MAKSWEQHYLDMEAALVASEDPGNDAAEIQAELARAVAHGLAALTGVTAVNSVAEVRKSYENLQIGLVTRMVTEQIDEGRTE